MKATPMIVHPFAPESLPTPISATDEVKLAVQDLLDGRHGALRIADALATVAAELVAQKAGKRAAAAWLRQIADEIADGH